MSRSSKSRSNWEIRDIAGVVKLGTLENPDHRDHICEARQAVIYKADLVLHAECGQPYTACSGSHGQAHASCGCRGLPPRARPSVVDVPNPRGESLCLQPKPACVGSSSGSQAPAGCIVMPCAHRDMPPAAVRPASVQRYCRLVCVPSIAFGWLTNTCSR